MSYDLAIWKRSATPKTAMLAEAYTAITDGGVHPAMAPFDVNELETALTAVFGEFKGNSESMIDCESATTPAASWLVVHCLHSDAEEVIAKVVPAALELGLLVYDPQRQAVWGNRRPAKDK